MSLHERKTLSLGEFYVADMDMVGQQINCTILGELQL